MATYTKHIHGCAYRDCRYKSQAAAKESRSQETQDVRRKAQRLSEATTRYSEVNGNRRDIGSMKFWGRKLFFFFYLAAGYLVWLVDGVCSVRKRGRATRCFWRGDVRARESRVEYRKHDGKWVFGVKDEFAISLAVLLRFSEPLLRFLSCLNTSLHANPSLRTLKLLSWVSRTLHLFYLSLSSMSWFWYVFCSVGEKNTTIVFDSHLSRIAFALWRCKRRLVCDSLSSFLLISVFLSHSLSLLSPASWITTVNTVKSRQPHGQTQARAER